MIFNAPLGDVISVSSLNRIARELLETSLPPLWISGELSNLMIASSGHAYFSLKDNGAQVRCVMFRHKLAALPFRPTEGMQVELKGLVTLYEARGEFQITVDSMRSAGLGRLYEAFEKLKTKLNAEGLFSSEKKRPLPSHPHSIGIVTSPAAAALRDVVSTLKRRMPGIPIILYPAQVQGEGSAQQLTKAIETANSRQEVDVLIICRGGGSIEDLWSFNDETLARAVANSTIPTVSGVGHETDFTICDFVADQRAPTPTAAAELVSPNRDHLQNKLDLGKKGLERAWSRLLMDKSQRLDFLSKRMIHPGDKLRQQAQQLAQLQDRMTRQIHSSLKQRQWSLQLHQTRLATYRPSTTGLQHRLTQLSSTLYRQIHSHLQQETQQLNHLQTRLININPEAVLARGYAIIQKQNGQVVKKPDELLNHERVTVTLAEGKTEAIVEHPQGAQPSLPF